MHAQYEQSPPTSSLSITQQDSPPLVTRPATFSPVDPPPMMTTSYSLSRSMTGTASPPCVSEWLRSPGQPAGIGSPAGGGRRPPPAGGRGRGHGALVGGG